MPAALVVYQPRCFGHIRERAVAVISIQDIVSPICDEQIVKTIVVVIANAYRGCPSGEVQPGLFGDIGERSIAVIFIQPVRHSRWRVYDPRATQHEYVK